ncbi:hypothetical protein KUCAC02_004833, partial [Chaenocephalus aceratus]
VPSRYDESCHGRADWVNSWTVEYLAGRKYEAQLAFKRKSSPGASGRAASIHYPQWTSTSGTGSTGVRSPNQPLDIHCADFLFSQSNAGTKGKRANEAPDSRLIILRPWADVLQWEGDSQMITPRIHSNEPVFGLR